MLWFNPVFFHWLAKEHSFSFNHLIYWDRVLFYSSDWPLTLEPPECCHYSAIVEVSRAHLIWSSPPWSSFLKLTHAFHLTVLAISSYHSHRVQGLGCVLLRAILRNVHSVLVETFQSRVRKQMPRFWIIMGNFLAEEAWLDFIRLNQILAGEKAGRRLL